MSRWGKAPEGYIPGLGRGAVGFSTRADIGTTRFAGQQDEDAEAAGMRFDKWNGNEAGLLMNNDGYDEEDKDAEFQYGQIDQYMDERRKAKKEAKLKDFLQKNRNERPTFKQQFSDQKKELAKLKMEDWEGIPDIGDTTVKKKKNERASTPMTDKMIQQTLTDNQIVHAIDPRAGNLSVVGNLTEVGQAKSTIMNAFFENVINKVSGTTSVNPIGYLTSMGPVVKQNPVNEIADIQKAKELLKSAVLSNPNSPAVWLSAARVQELDGKLTEARNIICQAANNLPDSEDIWLEAARLHPPEQSKAILKKGISHIPNSAKLWLKSANSEHDVVKKGKVLRFALEHCPASEEIWKAIIEMENEDVAKVLLYKAIECVPTCVDFWLSLARLETYDNARALLNKARKAVPTDHTIYIHAAKLEEAQNPDSPDRIDEIINRCIRAIGKHGKIIPIEIWLDEAANCEIAGSVHTCRAIVNNAIKTDTISEDKQKLLLDLVEKSKSKGCIETARQIFNSLIELHKDDLDVWMDYINFEKVYGTKKSLNKLLEDAVKECGDMEIFWLMYAKHKWLSDGTESAKLVLNEGLTHHNNSESIYLALIKLERVDNNYRVARELANTALKTIGGKKIWKMLIQLEREINYYGGNDVEKVDPLNPCKKAIEQFPDYPKLYLLAGEMKEELGDFDEVIRYYESGIEKNKKNPGLYIGLSRIYAKIDRETNARSVFEKSLKYLPKNEKIWKEFILFELKHGKATNTSPLLSKALKECPESGALWALAIELEKKQTKHAKVVDALEKCQRDDRVMLAVANFYFEEKNYETAEKWFENALRINPLNGDIYVYYYNMKLLLGEDTSTLIKKIKEASPTGGMLWKEYSKKIENWKLNTEELLYRIQKDLNLE
jgi:pre-mRNA-processing factor 6